MLTKIAKLNNKSTFRLKSNVSSNEDEYETSKINCSDSDNSLENIINE